MHFRGYALVRRVLAIGLLFWLNEQLLAQSALLAEPPIIPRPVSFQKQPGTFELTPQTTLRSDASVPDSTLAFFKTSLAGAASLPKKTAETSIYVTIDPQKAPHAEGYLLTITSTQIALAGHDAAGLFYGWQSLQQWFSVTRVLPACIVVDYPRFGYRGMHLDVSRHFFDTSFIKKYIDLLALYKFNTFHWHLTDDQGWRIEIKKYPLLQQISAYRNETLIGHKKELPHRFDGKRYGGYYTQAEIKDIIAYARKRHITIIPEIEMPGHALSALAAYPQLGCTGGPYSTATFWGVFDEAYCAGNDSTFAFLQYVLDEVIALFPSEYIHIGGDECVKKRWQQCPKCQLRMRTEQLNDEDELQSYFMKRISDYVYSKGRKVIGWDEILEGGLPPSAAVMSWRGTEGGIAAAKARHYAVMTPESHVYLDYYQSLHPEEPLAAAGYTPLSKVYAYEPVPAGFSAEERAYIRGVQGNAWSEYMPTPAKTEYMVFPRALAIAEVAWSQPERKNYADFLRRLRQQETLLKSRNVIHARVYDEITDSVAVNNQALPVLHLKTTLPKGTIRYTTDGSAPTRQSPVYKQPVAITQTQTVRAAVFSGSQPKGRVYTQHFQINKATGRSVTFAQSPKGAYQPAHPWVAVNGVSGTTRYNTGEWIGFQGTQAEAVIDLQTQQTISAMSVNVLVYHWQRMWAPQWLNFAVSADGGSFQEVYTQTNFPENGINPVKATIMPVQARYIRIQAIPPPVIPAGEYGAGGKPWLLLDEFRVE